MAVYRDAYMPIMTNTLVAIRSHWYLVVIAKYTNSASYIHLYCLILYVDADYNNNLSSIEIKCHIVMTDRTQLFDIT